MTDLAGDVEVGMLPSISTPAVTAEAVSEISTLCWELIF